MDAVYSWAIVLALGSSAYWYYSRTSNPKTRLGRVVQAPEPSRGRQSTRRGDSKGKKYRDEISEHERSAVSADGLVSDGGKTADKKKKKNKSGKAKGDNAVTSALELTPPTIIQDKADEDESLSNKEFARRMSGVKAGTLLTPSTQQKPKAKSMKQRHSQVDTSASTSTTGRDAEDGLSATTSPSLGGKDSGTVLVSGDISDMLEAPAEAAGVLRLTDPVQPPRQKQQRQQKPAPVQETKKQRQRRQRKEEDRLARQEDEAQRRILLEKQLRTAREAEGRPARNGMSAASPASNAWTSQSKPANNDQPSTVASSADSQLLDTFDSGKKVSKESAATNGKWAHELPSEEEQMRIINEMDENAGWNTVTKPKKGKKKGKTNADDGNESSDAGSTNGNTSKAENRQLPVQAPTYRPDPIPAEWAGHPLDSDWAAA
ncbi:MAG: hypothetical protein M1834_008152 [Cirrosporium novae-zelandiae]|nr:MAG: hypothetical protein M1834_008152 [Cirrosporium novae-zelandiae]